MNTWVIAIQNNGKDIYKEIFSGAYDKAVERAFILLTMKDGNAYTIL